MTSNEQHLSTVRKADLTLASLLSDGGYLLPEQSDKFIRLMVKSAVMMPMATVVPMKATEAKLNTIRFASRVLKPGTPGAALPSGDRVKPALDEVTLSAKLAKCEVSIEEEVFEDNIEQADLRNSIMQMLGEAISRDMEFVIINGDTLSADPLLALFDGVIKSTTSHPVDGNDLALKASTLSAARKALPHEYKVNPRNLVYWTSPNAEADYSDEVADRNTPLGDKVLENGQTPYPVHRNAPIMGIPEWPENLGTGSNRTCAILTDPKNLHVGIHKQIQIKTVEDVKAGNVIIVGKVRFDARWANEDATVRIYDVKAD